MEIPYESYHFFIKTLPVENVSFIKNENKCNILKYWISQNNSLTFEDLKSLQCFTTYWNPKTDDKIEIEFKGVNGKYFYFLVEDTNNNYSIAKMVFTLDEDYHYYMDLNACKNGTIKSNSGFRHFWLQTYNKTTNKWNKPGYYTVKANKDIILKNDYKLYQKTSETSEDIIYNDDNNHSLGQVSVENSFFRINFDRYADVNRLEWDFNSKLYFQPQYFISSTKPEDPARNVFEGKLGLTIQSNLPTFAHSIFCTENLGSSLFMWETYGKEFYTYYSEKTYTYNPSEMLPKENGYFVTIVYFADGHYYKSEVEEYIYNN